MAAMEVAMAVEVVAMAAETAVAMDVPRVAVERAAAVMEAVVVMGLVIEAAVVMGLVIEAGELMALVMEAALVAIWEAAVMVVVERVVGSTSRAHSRA